MLVYVCICSSVKRLVQPIQMHDDYLQVLLPCLNRKVTISNLAGNFRTYNLSKVWLSISFDQVAVANFSVPLFFILQLFVAAKQSICSPIQMVPKVGNIYFKFISRNTCTIKYQVGNYYKLCCTCIL